ncbi:hypothetical protein VOLCADRAFT_95870 [Volvox carteri f. nagariensis]|uniref:Ribonuclease n=1 Tax=Volvox carteri f. nagariensis TaxID=3068 RepID=D8U8L3_VOLCA|nr:uncharacterized protein VOLCADRAFT_95870 [Volvox carteri f. nagariensis]EFJ43941.1 hypothetical protein VOLCADRAFT_95870 [Volvox carteri f. nagariensis]|eukprot:XP_002954953.1 hypothetical protein VOLCADRAFT_95870 [Volvox carteri f. nagariensis]
MATGWLRGVVKEVVSGDTLVIAGTTKGPGPAPEKRITLSSLIAPKLGKRDGSSKDEPFAWDSREFLRKKCIGQPCVFRVDYLVEAIGNREFGSVFLNQQDNVAIAVVTNGWAKVRAIGKEQSPYLEDLKRAEEAAQAAGVGLWCKDPQRTSRAVRETVGQEDDAASALLSRVGKGGMVDAVVDAVLSGSSMRVTLLPTGTISLLVNLAGVQCPSVGRKAFTEARVLNRDVKLVLEGVDKYGNLFGTVLYTQPAVLPGAAAPAAPDAPPATAAVAAATEQSHLAEQLLKQGLAKCVEWSLGLMPSSAALRLRDVEKAAKAERKAIWTNYVPAPTNQTKLSDNFTGKVVEVVSGDCVVVKDATNGAERRVNLSSIRAPRPPARDRPAEAWATEAKEFLRKRIIGRPVEVKMEYTRKVLTPEMMLAGDGERLMAFGNVELVPEKVMMGGEEKQNVAEMAVARGFATVIKHRTDEERSCVYERLVACEELAKSSKRGVHSSKEPPANRVNDVSTPGSAARAKQYLPFFQRAGKMTGVVEYVLSGHRLRVHIPKEGVTIVFAPSGIKTPSRPQPAANGKPAVQGEPFAEEAFSYTREVMMQRDVEVTVETMDRGGTFLGSVVLVPQQQQQGGGAAASARPFNLALALLSKGFARLQPNVDPSRLPDGGEMVRLQQAAKEQRLKIWENWTPEMDREEGVYGDEEGYDTGATPTAANGAGASNGHGASTAAATGSFAAAAAAGGGTSTSAAAAAPAAGLRTGGRAQEVLSVTVTEVVDATEFFVQVAGEPRVAWLAEQLSAASLNDSPPIPPELKTGQLCLAQFSLDQCWYRGYVERVNRSEPMYDVFFIDYGNRERVASSKASGLRMVRTIDAAMSAVPPQAIPCCLAYIKVPEQGSDWAADARACLSSLLGGGRPFLAHVVSRERADSKAKHPKQRNGKITAVLVEPETNTNMAVEMLLAGMARLPKLRKVKDAAAREAIQAMQEYEDEARQAHRGMFMYGDPGDSDDEEPAAGGGRPGGAGRGGRR